MEEQTLRPSHALAIMLLAGLTLGSGLGRSKLTYHEAIGAQSAREWIAAADPLIPTLDGRPWLEKPPLETWSIAAIGRLAGGVDEVVARAPSVIAAVALCLIVASLAARRFGSNIGLLSGSVQATSAWLVTRGRLAEVDVILAAMVAAAIFVFERLRGNDGRGASLISHPWPFKTLGFYSLLGACSLAKGIGFGAAMIVAIVVVVLIWDRDKKTFRALASPLGWAIAVFLTLAWPLAVAAKYPEAPGLWVVHVSDRFQARPEQFAGERWWEFGLSLFWQTLPWTPLAMIGAVRSWRRAVREPGGFDRLLLAWAVAPVILVSMASVRNGHYLIHALAPWSIWAALSLSRLGERLGERGSSMNRVQRTGFAVFATLGLLWAVGLGVAAPRLDRRAAEWTFYETAGRCLDPKEPLILLYDWPEWDRFPYPTPFGPMPHDLAVRLFYLKRPASWQTKSDPLPTGHFAIIARRTDCETLQKLGRVEILSEGPTTRWDRAYRLYRIDRSGLTTEITEKPETDKTKSKRRE